MSDFQNICFGLDRQGDEEALRVFFRHLGQEPLASLLTSRMSGAEMTQVFDLLSGLLRRHLRHEEYHALLLGEGPTAE